MEQTRGFTLIGIPVLEEGIAPFIGNMRRSLIGLIERRFWEGMGLDCWEGRSEPSSIHQESTTDFEVWNPGLGRILFIL